jgi:hypothetical protein
VQVAAADGSVGHTQDDVTLQGAVAVMVHGESHHSSAF